MTITPFRDAANLALASMRDQVAALPPGPQADTGAMSLAVMEAVLTRLADMRDRHQPSEQVERVVIMAIANLLTSLAMSWRQGDPVTGHALFHELVTAIDRQGCMSMTGSGPSLQAVQSVARPVGGHA